VVFDTQYSTEVVFEHNKFHALLVACTKPLIKDKWNIVVLKQFFFENDE